MRDLGFRARTRRFHVLALVAGVTIAATLATVGHTAAGSRFAVAVGLSPAPARAAAGASESVPPLILVLTSTGFAQDTIEVPAGDVDLTIRNGSGADLLTFNVTQAVLGINQSFEVRLGARVSRRVNLKPGEWVITEANHPDWTCRVVVT
jgi:hypothetical protein